MGIWGCYTISIGRRRVIDNYRVQRNQIYMAADGGNYGVLVVDADLFSHLGDVIVVPFSASTGFAGSKPYRIDTFKLTMCRYFLKAQARECGG